MNAESAKLPMVRQRSARRPRGVRTAYWVFVFLPLAIVLYEIARLTPMYLNYMKVVRALNLVANEYHAGDDPDSLTRLIASHFATEKVVYPQAKDIRITRDGQQWLMEASYDDQAPLIGNMAVLVSFEKTVRAPRRVSN